MIPEFKDLPPEPGSKADLDKWKDWASKCLACNRFPRFDETSAADPTAALAMRALIAGWSNLHPGFEKAAPAAEKLLGKAHEAPPAVIRAAELLVKRVMKTGATTTDVLYLCAAFAWPLRDTHPELSDQSWRYLAERPWQTDAPTLAQWCTVVEKVGAMDDDRLLTDLADARLECGQPEAARELLEGIAVVQANATNLHQIGISKTFATKPRIQGADQALVKLAHMYQQSGEVAVHAREVLRRAVRIRPEATDLSDIQRERIWETPFPETYKWVEDLKSPRDLEAKLRIVVEAKQVHHARRIAEAVLINRYNKCYVGDPTANLPGAMNAFCKADPRDILAHDLSRCAVEHLALLYRQSNHATQSARDFVSKTLTLVPVVGKGGPLYRVRRDLERFVTENDPFALLREQDALLSAARSRFGDSEKAAEDQVCEWFANRRNSSSIESVISAITAPITDLAARASSSLPGIEAVCENTLGFLSNSTELAAGNINRTLKLGASIRAKKGIGKELLAEAMDLTRQERLLSSVFSAGSSLLPPGLALAAVPADLGVTLMAAFRAIAVVGALYGIDVREPKHLRFVADSFALGCSSKEHEGLAAYLSGRKQRVTIPVTVGPVSYGSSSVAGYLWTAGGGKDQAVRHLSRLVGVSLSKTAAAKIVPVAGVILSGLTTFSFMSSVVEAAAHVACREALFEKAQQSV